ncbi:sugar transferase [Pseudomonadota bacterium]
MKRIFDLLLCLVLLVPILFVAICVALVVRIFDGPKVLHWSKRVGRNNTIFLMPKFRSMSLNTPQVATHLLKDDSTQYVTFIGRVLRKTSLDELPQLYSVLKGDMSFVGPRPALFNQDDLVELRTRKDVHLLYPGITGWAQLNGRDEISIEQKVTLDREYLEKRSILFDCKIILMTAFNVFLAKDISH